MRRSDVVIFCVAAIVRVLFVWGQTEFGWFQIEFVTTDSQRYIALAGSLTQGAGLSVDAQPTASSMPGYPLFLAGLSLLGLNSPFAIGLVQSLVGALMCVFIGRIGRTLGGDMAGWLAGGISAAYPHFIVWTGYVLTETLFVCLVAAALWALVRLPEEAQGSLPLRQAIGCGLLLGLATLVRVVVLGFGLAAMCWIVWAIRRPLRYRIIVAAVAASAMAVPVGFWIGRNALTVGVPVLSTQLGHVFYHGNSPGATGGSRGYVDDEDYTPLAVPDGLSEVEVDRYYRQEAVAFLRSNPAVIPRLFLQKLGNMWRPTYEGASLKNVAFFGGSYVMLMALGAVGMALALRRSLVPAWLLVLFICIFIFQHGLVIGMIRFRLAAEVAIVPFAAYSLLGLGMRLKGHFERRGISSLPANPT